MSLRLLRAVPSVLALACLATAVPVQAQPPAAPNDTQPLAVQDSGSRSNGHVGVAVRASTLGFGIEGAVRLHRRVNARIGTSMLTYNRDFDDEDSGVTYTGELSLRSVDAHLDLFPFGGGFHVSPGLTLQNNNHVSLSATVGAGQTVSVDDVDYLGTAANPIRVAGKITVASVRPALTIGWGNIIPRNRRFSVPFELGVVFQGQPVATLAYTGTACAPNGSNCRDMATDPIIQGHVRAEEANLNDDLGLGALRYYPVLSLGIGFRF